MLNLRRSRPSRHALAHDKRLLEASRASWYGRTRAIYCRKIPPMGGIAEMQLRKQALRYVTKIGFGFPLVPG